MCALQDMYLPKTSSPYVIALEKCPVIEHAIVYACIGSVALTYASEASVPSGPYGDARSEAVGWLGMIDSIAIDEARKDCVGALAPQVNDMLLQLAEIVGSHFLRRWFLPLPLDAL